MFDCLSRWTYHDAGEDESGLNTNGLVQTYPPGGYLVLLPNTRGAAKVLLDFLYSNTWLDRGTRAVILDLTTYNANINLFCVIK